MYKPLQMASVLASIIVLLTACDSKSGDASEPLITGAVPTTESEAARFLSQTTFGPTKVEIDFVSTYGYEIWVDQQMSLPGTLMIPDLETKIQQAGIPLWGGEEDDNEWRRQLFSDVWYQTAVHAEDQLRQRVTFALSQILVVSELPMNNHSRAVAHYNDLLVKNAFGNYRNLLEAVTLSAAMGHYLSMRRNVKADPARNIEPDENYAREVMQLFSIGLYELNPDGTYKVDSNGKTMETYNQEIIKAFARVYTGWNYSSATELSPDLKDDLFEVTPMKAFEDYHDTGEKILLGGQILPAGQTAAQDLQGALDNIFNHPNVGPFISKQLIQRLVTSNPSPEYVANVATVFNDNGSGVRGDLKAVVKAILLDDEALYGHENFPTYFGKLKEPVIRLTALWRAFNAQGDYGNFRFANSKRYFGQKAYAADHVFNFYSPTYSQQGPIRDQNLVSPEFEILTDPLITNTTNVFRDYAFSQQLSTDSRNNRNTVYLDIEEEKKLAGDPATLVDHLDLLMLSNNMPESMKTVIVEYLDQEVTLDDDGTDRVKEAIYLIISSPEYAIQR